MTMNLKGISCSTLVGLGILGAFAPAHAAGPSNEELLRRIERLEQALLAERQARQADQEALERSNQEALQQAQQSQTVALKAAQAEQEKAIAEAQTKSDKDAWWHDTKVSGRMYYNITSSNAKRDGVKQSSNGTGLDIKRFYVGIDHKFNDTFAANITTDFTYDSGPAGATQIYIKKAYLEAKLDPAFVVRVGSTDLPWVPFVEDLYGFRYVENTLIDRTKFGTSADWGLHLSGKLADGMVEYAFAAVDGAGYKHPLRSKSVDVEGRVDVKYKGFVAGVGGYSGKLGKDIQGTTTYHTATRFDAVAAYVGHGARVGVEAFTAKNWNTVASITSDKSEGIGAFASYQFMPKWTVFGKYEYVRPYKRTNHDMSDNYFNVGISYTPTKIVDFALVYKRDRAEDGFISTSNGAIGGLVNGLGHDGTYNEIGLWGQLRW